MPVYSNARAALRSLVLLLICGAAADAAEITVVSSPGARAVMDVMGPEFERATGHKLTIRYALGPQARQQIAAGETFDVAIVSFDVDEFIKQGRIAAGTRAVFGQTGIGVAVRKDAPKPDISTPDAFKSALLSARSISYAGGSPGAHILKLFERLGIAQTIKPKLIPTTEISLADVIARGEPPIAVNGVAPILNTPGAELVGWLPPELQDYVLFTGGVSATAKDAAAGQALLKRLTTPDAAAAFKRIGVEPAAR